MNNLRRHPGKQHGGRLARLATTAVRLAAALALALAGGAMPAGAAPATTGLVVTRFDDPAPNGCVSGSDCSLRDVIGQPRG